MSARTLRRFRPWVQAAAFVLFLVLLIGAGKIAFLPADLFFRLDPLAGLATMIAARRIAPVLLIGSVIALVATLILGRVWCGWLCPLGTVLDWTPARRSKRFEPDPAPWLRRVKYFLLALIGVAALLGNLTFLILDPITLIYRTMASAVWPALIALISGVETILYKVPFFQGAGGLVRRHRPRRPRADDAAGLRPGHSLRPDLRRRPGAQCRARPLLVPVPVPAGRAAGAGQQGLLAAPDRGRRLRGLPALRPGLPHRHDRPAARLRQRPGRVHHVSGVRAGLLPRGNSSPGT